MMTSKRTLSLLVGVALSISVSACTPSQRVADSTPSTTAAPITTTTTTAPACEEDMPCWNCKTMGNHTCNYGTLGPYTVTDDIHAVPAKDPTYNAVCWTEYNPYLEKDGTPWWNQEGICGDPSKAHPQFFLHWGMGAVADMQMTDDFS